MDDYFNQSESTTLSTNQSRGHVGMKQAVSSALPAPTGKEANQIYTLINFPLYCLLVFCLEHPGDCRH